MSSLDSYMIQPAGKREYLANHGYHFSKRAFQFATKRMRKKDGSGNENEVKPYTNDETEEMLSKYGIKLKNDHGYDKAYIASMLKADCLGSSIEDERHLAMGVKDFLDDVDGGEERAFRHWYSDMIEKGVSIPWEDIV